MTLQEFGQKIKLKHPQYQNIDDTELANKMIAKYPQYKNQISEPKQITQPQETKGFLGRVGDFVKKDIFGGGAKTEGYKDSGIGEVGKTIFQETVGSKGLAGVAQLPGKTLLQGALIKEKIELSESQTELATGTQKLIDVMKAETDPDKKAKYRKQIKGNLETLGIANEANSILDDKTLSPGKTISTSANAGLTALTGSGSAVKSLFIQGAKKLPTGSKVATNLYRASTAKKALLPRAIEMGGISGGFQASSNIANNKPLLEDVGTSTGFGMALPVAGKVLSKGKQVITKSKLNTSEKVINSLIKPLLKDLSYGKNPGRGVAKEGIVFNSLEEGAVKINSKLKEIGGQINTIVTKYKSESLDLSNALKPIDDALVLAKETPRTNAVLINRLQDAKNDLLGVVQDLGGKIIITKDLSKMTFKEAVNFKRMIGRITKFTGNASDDKEVNTALKRVYGKTKGEINKKAPELKPLNARWADLQSAEIAIKYRDKIEMRQNLISFTPKIAGMLFGSAGVATLNPALIASAVLTVGLDKLLSSPAFKTRFAKWLAKSSKAERLKLIRNAPVLKNILDRIFGKDQEKAVPLDDIIKKLDISAGLSIKNVDPKDLQLGDHISMLHKKLKNTKDKVARNRLKGEIKKLEKERVERRVR